MPLLPCDSRSRGEGFEASPVQQGPAQALGIGTGVTGDGDRGPAMCEGGGETPLYPPVPPAGPQWPGSKSGISSQGTPPPQPQRHSASMATSLQHPQRWGFPSPAPHFLLKAWSHCFSSRVHRAAANDWQCLWGAVPTAFPGIRISSSSRRVMSATAASCGTIGASDSSGP